MRTTAPSKSSIALTLLLSLLTVACSETDTKPESDVNPLKPKVLVIGWDGVRADAVQVAATPTLDAAVASGAYTFEASTQTETFTVSAPGWLSLLTGVQPSKHKVYSNEDFTNHSADFPTMLARAKHDLGLTTAGACDWEMLCALILEAEESLDISEVGDETEVTESMERWLAEDDYDLHFIHLDLPDHAGHEHGFSPDITPYLEAIELSDTLSGRLLAAIESRPARAQERWLIAMVTDHGGNMNGHGDLDQANRRVHFVLRGDGVQAGPLPGDGSVTQMDLLPTVLTYLGAEIDPTWQIDGQPVGLK